MATHHKFDRTRHHNKRHHHSYNIRNDGSNINVNALLAGSGGGGAGANTRPDIGESTNTPSIENINIQDESQRPPQNIKLPKSGEEADEEADDEGESGARFTPGMGINDSGVDPSGGEDFDEPLGGRRDPVAAEGDPEAVERGGDLPVSDEIPEGGAQQEMGDILRGGRGILSRLGGGAGAMSDMSEGVLRAPSMSASSAFSGIRSALPTESTSGGLFSRIGGALGRVGGGISNPSSALPTQSFRFTAGRAINATGLDPTTSVSQLSRIAQGTSSAEGLVTGVEGAASAVGGIAEGAEALSGLEAIGGLLAL